MTRFSDSSFTVSMGGTDAYREGCDRMPCSVEGCERSFGHRGEHASKDQVTPATTTDETAAQEASKQTP